MIAVADTGSVTRAAELLRTLADRGELAPDATPEAQAIVAAKKNLRLLLASGLPDPRSVGLTAKTVAGGLLESAQEYVVTDPDLSPQRLMEFAGVLLAGGANRSAAAAW